MRLGFLTHLHIGEDAGDSYRLALELFTIAEELGYDSGWVAQHHFLNNGARLPSTLAFLAAAAERTRRIGLGTAIVILPLEDPLRVAEDAAVVDTLSGGRLQLGLGTGGDPLTFAAFGQDVAARRERYIEGVRVIQDALAGLPINGTEAVLYPPAPTLTERVWESTLSPEGGARIGRNGNGLLLARTAFLSSDPTDVNQLPVAQAYLRNLALSRVRRGEARRDVGAGPEASRDICAAQREPHGRAAPESSELRGRPDERGSGGEVCPGPVGESRIGLSRAVYPAADRRTAVSHLEHGVAEYVDSMIGRGHFPRGLSQEAYFARSHIHHGHPEEVIASLRADRVFPMATDLIVQVHPGHPTPDQLVTALERIAKEVAPALGWRPHAAAQPA
jgi:alkanesulfonate monooxygenase SsuD/methylene tetrahydromethanopterin reductase-like flavin-dependent oxidoreductase (luciferase family)